MAPFKKCGECGSKMAHSGDRKRCPTCLGRPLAIGQADTLASPPLLVPRSSSEPPCKKLKTEGKSRPKDSSAKHTVPSKAPAPRAPHPSMPSTPPPPPAANQGSLDDVQFVEVQPPSQKPTHSRLKKMSEVFNTSVLPFPRGSSQGLWFPYPVALSPMYRPLNSPWKQYSPNLQSAQPASVPSRVSKHPPPPSMPFSSQPQAPQGLLEKEKISRSISLTKDLHVSTEQIIRMAKCLELDVLSLEPQSSDPVFKWLYPMSSEPIAFPMLQGLLDIAKGVWAKPASVSPSDKKLEAMYKVKKQGCEFLFMHPAANSLVTEFLPSKRSGAHITSFDKEGRKSDSLGRKMYTSAALTLRIANFNAITGRYQVFLWERIMQHLDTLPDDKRSLVRMLQAEGIKIGKQQINAARHLADTASRAMASAVVLRRHSWLQATAASSYIKAKVEDLPFEGTGLFSTQTDEVLHQIRKNKLIARALGITSPPAQGFRPRHFRRHHSHQQY
ncbi:uncharacterized protein LOC132587820 [Heteronotia binoei]|uniref:uncharacterized protein LOC132587820 n=1 Tax=Heteronotia binoei TaxID=13085 RepID=UPI002931132C|nr:uncharacterized protein LOC132587820 [Heteronotia binoei]